MRIPENVRLLYKVESEEVADITERAINDLPIEMHATSGTGFIVTGFDRRKRPGQEKQRFHMCATMHQVSEGIVSYRNLGTLSPGRYESAVGESLGADSLSHLTVMDKQLGVCLTIGLGFVDASIINKDTMHFARGHYEH